MFAYENNRFFWTRIEYMAKRNNEQVNETFGQRLTRLRKQSGVTQIELADAIGVAQSNVSNYEHDIFRPSSDLILRIANALKISTDELFGKELKQQHHPVPIFNRKVMRRLSKIDKLSRRDQQALLRTIDAFLYKS